MNSSNESKSTVTEALVTRLDSIRKRIQLPTQDTPLADTPRVTGSSWTNWDQWSDWDAHDE
jgi:hypothetical protein